MDRKGKAATFAIKLLWVKRYANQTAPFSYWFYGLRQNLLGTAFGP